MLEDCQLDLSRALFNSNCQEDFWKLFENIYKSILENPSENIGGGLYRKLDKTIVVQAIMYCLGNNPAFPTSFDYENYYYILYIENDKELIKICRKGKNFVIRTGEEYAVFDNTSELKRYWNKNIQKIPVIKKERGNAISRRTKNEIALKELRSLNRTMKTGQISCMDCGSRHIAYESADYEFSFDISTTKMRKQILDAVQEKVDIYNEEIVRLSNEIIG